MEKSLIIKPADKKELPINVKIDVDLIPDVNTLLYIIQMYYLQGVNTIQVTSNNIIKAEVKKKIKGLSNVLPNIDIQDISGNLLQINVDDSQNFIRRDYLINIFTRMFKFTLRLLEDLKQALMNNDSMLMQEMVERSKDIKKRYAYVVRLLAKISQMPEYSSLSIREIVIYAEIARDLFQLINHVANAINYMQSVDFGNADIVNKVLNLVSVLIDMFTNTMDYFNNREITLITYIKDKMSKVKAIEYDVLSTVLSGHTNVSCGDKLDKILNLMYLVRELRRIAGYCIAIMDDISQLYLGPF